MSLTVVTVLRSGGDYDVGWFYALKRGLLRHLSIEYRAPTPGPLEPGTWTLWCLTDLSVGRAGIPLEHGWPGWWSKVEIFRPGLFEGLVLYLDLDTLVVDDLAPLAEYSGRLAMLSDFYQPKIVASGVMLFRPGAHTEAVYSAFQADPLRIMAAHRRSDFWYAKQLDAPDRLQELYPDQLVSLKAHARLRAPDGARLVCGHGRPRLSDPAAGWAHTEWSRFARAS